LKLEQPETPRVTLWRRRVIARPDDGQEKQRFAVVVSNPRNEKAHMKSTLTIKPLTLEDVLEILHNALIGFENDPADTEFQEGYEQALKDMVDDLIGRRTENTLHELARIMSLSQPLVTPR